MVTYRLLDGRRVNPDWYVFLTKARHDGVSFHLNQGKRTIAEQWRFWRIYKRDGWPLAAYPSPWAPHVRDDTQHPHAIDADNLQALIDYGARHGVTIRRTVAGEGWHGETTGAELRAFARRHGGAVAVRRGDQGQTVRNVQTWLRRAGLLPAGRITGRFGPETEHAVRRFQARFARSRHKLTIDGVAGPKTQAALRRRYGWQAWKARRR